MPPLLVAYAVASLAVLALHAAGCVGLVRLLARERRRAGEQAVTGITRASVEVVVAARDEEAALPSLLARRGQVVVIMACAPFSDAFSSSLWISSTAVSVSEMTSELPQHLALRGKLTGSAPMALAI